MKLNDRLKKLETKNLPTPTLKVFTQSIDGTITGESLKFKDRAEYEKYAEDQGFNDCKRINSVLFVEIVNAKGKSPE